MARDLRLVVQQIRYQNKIFWRTPIAAFFTLVFPLMFLVLFASIFGNDEIEELGITVAQFYAPALAVFGAASATYTNLATSTAIARDEGILKRVRGTPLPPWIYIAGRVGSAIWIAVLAVTLMMSVGIVVYNVELIGGTFPAAVLSFLVGAATFAALGLFVAAMIKNGDSAPAVTNATLLPIAFVSDVFIAIEDPPVWLDTLGNIFPLKHFVAAFGDAFHPGLSGSGFSWTGTEFSEVTGTGEYAIGLHLAVMAAWGIAAAVLAVRYFRWDPRGMEGRVKRRRGEATVSGNDMASDGV